VEKLAERGNKKTADTRAQRGKMGNDIFRKFAAITQIDRGERGEEGGP